MRRGTGRGAGAVSLDGRHLQPDQGEKLKPTRNTVLTTTDLELLEFLWRWKVATTALLSAAYYADRTPKKAYYRLRHLEAGGFLQTKRAAAKFLWTLTKRGYLSIRGRLPELVEEGFQSEAAAHDLVVTALHLGPCYLAGEGTPEFFTEQEMRRYSPHAYPEWAPRSVSHRPDGFWRVLSGRSRVIAVEAELHEKGRDDYLSVASYYDRYPEVEAVVWLVKTPAAARRIQSHLSANRDLPGKHAFLTLPAFLEHGWRTPIELGAHAGLTLENLLGYRSGTGRVPVPGETHLNLSKSPHRSKRCRVYSFGDAFY